MKSFSLLLSSILWVSTTALKHSFFVWQDARTLIAPVGTPYAFLKGGCFNFDVFKYHLEVGPKHRVRHPIANEKVGEKQLEIIQSLDAGFLLKRFSSESAFVKYKDEILSNSSHCIFEPFRWHEDDPIFNDDDGAYSNVGDVTKASGDGIFLPIRWANSTWSTSTASVIYEFDEAEAGLYFLMYQVCPKSLKAKHAELRSSFFIDFHYRNKDTFGMDSYLTAGEMPLPVIFFYFFMSYLICTVIWILNILGIQRGREGCFANSGERPVVYKIHHLMSILLVVKTATVLLESIRYHYIRITGHAEFWSVLYYIISFVKSIFLFTVVLLIGSGWSFIKPFLSTREKWVILLVLILQVLDNIALVILASESEGESVYDDWSAILHMLDILCCCAVLVPIVWQVSSLEKNLELDEQEIREEEDEQPIADAQDRADKEKTLAKLKLFRQFYLLVVAYIYFTRIAIYLFATMLDYRHTWVRYFITELATLAFYIIMGLQFRPMTENPYLVLDKKEDEVEFERGVELGERGSNGKK